MVVFVVEMLRDGDRELHSYIAGVYDNEMDALVEACEHIDYRANKYTAYISLFGVNKLRYEYDYRRHIGGIKDLEEQNKELAEIVKNKIIERSKA